MGSAPVRGLKTKQALAYEAVMKKWYPKLPAADGFVYNYYNAAWALVRALKANGGQVGAALQRAMPKTNQSAYEVSDGGVVKLDARRQAIQDQYPLQVVRNADGSIGTKIVGFVPNVDQSFGGLFKPSSPAPGRSQPKCVKKKLPWQGKIREVQNGVITKHDHQVGMTEAPNPVPNAVPTLRLRGVGRRFGGLLAVSDVDLDVAHGERRAILGPNGAGKTTLFNVISGDLAASSGSVELFGEDVTTVPPRKRTKRGLARTYQQSRMLLGVSVEDSIYLSALGVGAGHLRPVTLPRDDDALRERARAAARRAAIDHRLSELVGNLSHGEHRQVAIAMALASEPKLLMLDEPASGLSRGERQLLTELLLALDPDITLVLIEHDMDVALTVAERVTMMHNGRVIVEGTPGRDPRQHARPRPLPGPAPPDAMSDVLLAVEGLQAYYSSAQVLHDVTLLDGQGVGRDRRPQRHGQDDAVQRDHGVHASARERLRAVRGEGADRQAAAQDRPRGARLRPAGPAPLSLAHGRTSTS